MRELTPGELELIAGGDSTQYYGGNDYDWYVRGNSEPTQAPPGWGVAVTGNYDTNSHTETIDVAFANSATAVSDQTGGNVVVYGGIDGNLQTVNLSVEIPAGSNSSFSVDISQLASGHVVTENIGNGHSLGVAYLPNYYNGGDVGPAVQIIFN